MLLNVALKPTFLGELMIELFLIVFFFFFLFLSSCTLCVYIFSTDLFLSCSTLGLAEI